MSENQMTTPLVTPAAKDALVAAVRGERGEPHEATPNTDRGN